MPVEQVEKELFTSESRRADAEFRRLDSEMTGVKKSQEKFETKTEKAINDLRIDVGALRTDMNARFDSMRNDISARFGKIDEKIDGNFKAAVTIYLTAMGLFWQLFTRSSATWASDILFSCHETGSL
jgi:hypothetical protein